MLSSQVKKVASGDFILGQNTKAPRKVTIVITKKVAPRAVDRNRIRRVVKEALKENVPVQGHIKIIVKNNLANLKMQEVSKKLTPLLKKI